MIPWNVPMILRLSTKKGKESTRCAVVKPHNYKMFNKIDRAAIVNCQGNAALVAVLLLHSGGRPV
jgi:hypothetical protein